MATEQDVVDPYAQARMTVLEHLGELRTRLVWATLGVLVGCAISWIWVEEIFNFLLLPLQTATPDLEIASMHHKDLAEPFFALLKTAIFSGAFFSAPWILYQLWSFIAPGLYPHEKKMAAPFVLLATAFFVAGASFCFFIVMPYGYKFLLAFSEDVSTPELMMNEYLHLTTKLLLGFGIIFEMPVLSMFLSRVGILTHRHLLKYWRYSVVVAFIISAMLTPPDILTQSMMAVPLIGLYFLSVGVAWYFTRRREKAEAKAAEEA